jgi:uncharacterized protein (TIGR02246 family)
VGETPRNVVDRYFTAERRLDPDAVADCFTDDGVLVEPDGTRHTGRTAIKAFYQNLYADLTRLDVWAVNEVTAKQTAAIEWEADVTGPDGTKHLRGVNLITTHDGHLAEARIYFTHVP